MQPDKREFAEQPSPRGGAGRIQPDPTRNDDHIPDISRVDCQEGEMNNGELGGNFRQEENIRGNVNRD